MPIQKLQIKTMETKITTDNFEAWVINAKYVIYKKDGYIDCVFEEDGDKIPQEVYDKRDQLMFNSK